MKKLVVLCSFFLALLACSGGDEDEAKQAVLIILKDPDSAKFGQLTTVPAKKYEMACISVKVQSTFDDHEENKQALLGRVKGKKWEAKYLSDASHEQCVELVRKYLKDK